MWNPIKIEFENLFSHRHSEYAFKNGKCVVIFGENRTDRSLDNNGAGKTTLFEAICIGLTNESLRNIKKDEFINEDADFCKITFELYNPVKDMRLVIVRQFFRGNKSTKVELYENGVQNTQVVSVLEANKRVLELLGISKEDLLRYYIISQDNHYTFFTASDVEKKEIMNRITSADMIQPAIEELKRRFSEVDTELGESAGVAIAIKTKIEALEEQKRELIENDTTGEQIADLKREILQYQNDIKERKDKRKQCNELLETLQGQLKALGSEVDTSKLYAQRKDLRAKLNNAETELSESKRVKSKIERELDGKVTCPDCGSDFIPKSELGLTYSEALQLKEESEAEIAKIEKQIESLNKQITSVTKEISVAEEQSEKRATLKQRIENGIRKIANLDHEDKLNDKDIARCNGEIEKLTKQKKENTAIANIDKKLKQLDEDRKEQNKKHKEIEARYEMISFWQFNMGKSGFMTYLANRSVKIIEGITNSYLRKFGVDISVIINGFKVLKSGEVREKIDVFVTNDGITAKPFMAKSGGERGRVMLAGVLGIQHLINMSTDGRGLNFIALDESFSGMDATGQENVIKILEQMGITIMVITQNVSDGFNNENTLKVVKENGVSKYIS